LDSFSSSPYAHYQQQQLLPLSSSHPITNLVASPQPTHFASTGGSGRLSRSASFTSALAPAAAAAAPLSGLSSPLSGHSKRYSGGGGGGLGSLPAPISRSSSTGSNNSSMLQGKAKMKAARAAGDLLDRCLGLTSSQVT